MVAPSRTLTSASNCARVTCRTREPARTTTSCPWSSAWRTVLPWTSYYSPGRASMPSKRGISTRIFCSCFPMVIPSTTGAFFSGSGSRITLPPTAVTRSLRRCPPSSARILSRESPNPTPPSTTLSDGGSPLPDPYAAIGSPSSTTMDSAASSSKASALSLSPKVANVWGCLPATLALPRACADVSA